MKISERQKGILSLIFAGACSSIMGVVIRIMGKEVGDYQQVYLTVGLGFFLGLILYRQKASINSLMLLDRKEISIAFIRSLFFYLLGGILYVKAFLIGNYATVSILQAVPMTAIIGVLVFKDKINSKKLLLLVVSFFGILLIILNKVDGVFQFRVGEILSIISNIFFALSFLLRRKHGKKVLDEQIAILMLFFSLPFIALISLSQGEGLINFSALSMGFIVAWIVGGLVNTLNLFFYNYGFGKLDSVLGSNLLMFESIFAIPIALLFYRENPNLVQIVGGVLVLICAYFMNKFSGAESDKE